MVGAVVPSFCLTLLNDAPSPSVEISLAPKIIAGHTWLDVIRTSKVYSATVH
jgi:hypothetical protein